MAEYDISKTVLPNGDLCNFKDARVQSLIQSAGPSNIVSVNDALACPAVDVTIDIDPAQDLHGYDYPWPAGGGKNLIPLTVTDIKAVNTSGTWNGNSWSKDGVTFTIMTDNTGNVTGINVNGTASAEVFFLLSVASKTLYSESCIASLESSISPCFFADSYSGKFNFSSEARNVTGGASKIEPSIRVLNNASVSNVLVKPMIRLASVSDATFAPYSNICSISGWTGAKIANISDSEKQPYFAGLLNGTYGFVDLGTLEWSYQSTEGGYFSSNSVIDKANGNTNCFATIYPNGGNVSITNMDNKTMRGGSSSYVIYVKDSSYTDAATFKTAMSGVYLVYELATPTTPTITKEQFELLLDKFGIGGWLAPISWQSEAGTVYGGTLDVTTGLLTVTMAEVDLGTLTWDYSGSNKQYFIGRTVNDARQIANSDIPNLICSNYVCDSNFNTIYGNVSLNNRITFDNIKEVIIRDTAYTDAATFKAAMSGVQLVYELATPQTYQLTPTEVTLLLGENNIWADTGDTTLHYRVNDAQGINEELIKKLPENFSTLPTISTTPDAGDVLPIESNGTTYKIDYNALAAAILDRLGAGTNGVVDIPHGGTGATTADGACANLGAARFITLARNTDINTVRTPGLYWCDGVKNTPIYPTDQRWGYMLIFGSPAETSCIQLYAHNTSMILYARRYYDGNWEPWYQLTSTIVT